MLVSVASMYIFTKYVLFSQRSNFLHVGAFFFERAFHSRES